MRRPYPIDVVWHCEPILRPFSLVGCDEVLFSVHKPVDYTVTIDHWSEDITVPAGFITDGASIPTLLRWVIPQSQPTWAPALLHDYFYGSKGWNKISRKTCDKLFGIALAKQNIPFYRLAAMYRSVALFGGYAWRKCGVVDQYNDSLGFFRKKQEL